MGWLLIRAILSQPSFKKACYFLYYLNMSKYVAIIGAGTMGSLLAVRAIERYGEDSVVVCDNNIERLEDLRSKYPAISITSDAAKAVAKADIVMFAVKPQDFFSLAEKIKSALSENVLCVSIMAGVSSKVIAETLGVKKNIRAMPNTAMRLGKAVTGWMATSALSEEEQKDIRAFFDTFGVSVFCDSDDDIDKVTAVSGSGPAYIFYTIECLVEAAKHLGFDEVDAKRLVLGTLEGAAALLAENPDPSALRKQVTSKGGTTAAALASLEEKEFSNIWRQAVDAAYRRAKEISEA